MPINMAAIATFYSYFHATAGLSGCLFNGVLIYLAVFESPKAITIYATLLVNVGITDFFTCFLDLIIQARHIPAGFTLAYSSHGICSHFGPHFCFLAYSIDIHFVAHGLWSLLLGFCYRYYILFHSAPTRKRLILVILIVYIPSFFQLLLFPLADDDPVVIRKILNARFPDYQLDNETVFGTINIISFPALYTIIHIACPITPVYIAIIILRKKIINKLQKHSDCMAPKTKQLHTQLLKALTYQALLPGFYSISIASYVTGQFFYNHPIFEHTTLTSYLFMPVLSPVSSIVFIKVYNRTVLSVFYRTFGKSIPTEWSSMLNWSRNSRIGHSANNAIPSPKAIFTVL